MSAKTSMVTEELFSRPDVFSFNCYRELIRAFEVYLVAKEKISLSKICKESGFKNFGYLKLIVEGKRNLHYRRASSLASALGMNTTEEKYFKILVLESSTDIQEDIEDFKYIRSQMKEFHRVKLVDQDLSELYSKWYINAALVLIGEKPELDAEGLAKTLELSKGDAEHAFGVLQRLGLIEKRREGWAKTSVRHQSPQNCGDGIRAYHASMLDIARASLESVESDKREFYGLTVSLSDQQYQIFKSHMWNFLKRLHSIDSSDEPSEPDQIKRLYHLGAQLFPLDQELWKK